MAQHNPPLGRRRLRRLILGRSVVVGIVASVPVPQMEDTLRAADHAIDQERFVDALRLVLPLASSAQGDPQLLLRLFQCYHGLGQLSEATALLERITYLCPDEAGTLALLVRLRAAQGQPALQVHDARRYLERMQALIGAPIDMVSTGPDRVHTILLRHPFRA